MGAVASALAVAVKPTIGAITTSYPSCVAAQTGSWCAANLPAAHRPTAHVSRCEVPARPHLLRLSDDSAVASSANGEPLEHPCWSSKGWRPFPVVPEEHVCENNQLSHDGGDSDLRGFADGFDAVVFCREIGIAPHGNESRHVECLADIGPAAADEGASGPLPGAASSCSTICADIAWRKDLCMRIGHVVRSTPAG